MNYRTFITDAARECLARLPVSRRKKVVGRIDRLVAGDFAGSQDLPVANAGIRLKRARVTPTLRIVYAVTEAKRLVAVVRLELAHA